MRATAVITSDVSRRAQINLGAQVPLAVQGAKLVYVDIDTANSPPPGALMHPPVPLRVEAPVAAMPEVRPWDAG